MYVKRMYVYTCSKEISRWIEATSYIRKKTCLYLLKTCNNAQSLFIYFLYLSYENGNENSKIISYTFDLYTMNYSSLSSIHIYKMFQRNDTRIMYCGFMEWNAELWNMYLEDHSAWEFHFQVLYACPRYTQSS